ncbi:MAG TPA: hypothetical protein ENK96_01770 [Desulfobulbaceae bacterium]|nr:hypothetical protein [Desulfobulbaceae bacterium]
MKKINSLLPLILLVILLFGCDRKEQSVIPSGKTIKIGVIGPMSGPEKALGMDSMEGMQTALLMQPYLHNGDALELVIEDDKNEPVRSVKAFRKLVTEDKVSAIILLSASASALAVNSIADNYHIPVLVVLATHPEISTDTQFVSQLCFDNIFQGKVAALFVRDELLIERAAVFINPDSSHSSSLADEFMREFRSIEGQIVDVIPITEHTVDFEESVSLLRNQDIQLLYLPVTAGDVVNISRALEKIGWKPKVMISDGLLANVLDRYPESVHLLNVFFTIELYSKMDGKGYLFIMSTEKLGNRIIMRKLQELQTIHSSQLCTVFWHHA